MKSSFPDPQLTLASGVGGNSTKLIVTVAVSQTVVFGAGKHTSYSKTTSPV